jgi:putative restriction endonuclease
MKADDWDDQLLVSHRTSMRAGGGRAAFELLVAEAATLPGFKCRPAWQGEVRVFDYEDPAGGARAYSIIVNRHDLLFCVRKPGLERVPGGLTALSERFGEIKENPADGWTVRLSKLADARALSGLLFGSLLAAETVARHWWVNHKHTFRQEVEGSYLWSPKANKTGARNVSYDNLTRTIPGDVVFSYAEGKIGAVGVVIDRVRTAPTPTESGEAAAPVQTEAGWLLPVRFELLPQPLAPKDHMTRLAPLLPPKHSPIRASGAGNQAVYLAEIPSSLAAVLRELLEGHVQEIEEKVAIETNDQLTDSAMEERIWQRTNLGPREKRWLINARLGQGVFRANVERIERSCRVTGVMDRRHLRATHIKPWKLSDDREKLDGYNGLLLSPHVDHLFSRGHISFSDDGRMLISMHLNPVVVKVWGLDKPRLPEPFGPQQRAYLEFHRRYIFEKVAGGRRV